MKNRPSSLLRSARRSASKVRDPRRFFSLTQALGLSIGLTVASFSVARATTELDVLDGQTDLFLATTYSQGTAPVAGSDVTFNLAAYTTTTFGLSGDLVINSLNDLSATALTLANSSGAARLITLSNNTALTGANATPNAVTGAATTDALYVASGGSLTIQGGTGTTALGLVLNTQPGVFGVLNTFNIAGTGTASISAIISGAGGFAKSGTGTLNLSGANTFTGPVQVAAGTLNVSGALGSSTVNNGSFRVGTLVNTFGTLNILPGATISRPNIFVGDAGGGTGGGAVYQSGGSLTLTQAANADNVRIGSNAGGYGYYNLSAGTLTANEIGVGGGLPDTVGVMDVTGGIATSNGYITVARGAGASSGTLNVTGGTVNFSAAAAGTGPLDLNFAATAGAQSVVNVGGGTGPAAITGGATATATNNNSFTGRALNLASANTANTLGVANLRTNGILTVSEVTAANANPTALFNFNGGTLRATATNTGANFMVNANIDQVNVYSAGGTVDNNGTGITIGRPLLAPAGSGVNTATVAVPAGGAGYGGAPLVKLTGGTGLGATGYATVAGGVVTGIVITSPGTGYTAGDTLTATFVGGGAATAATTVTGIPVAPNVSGGMTFTGAGTTTLSGASTYTGPTAVTGGTLLLNGSLAAGSAVTVSNVGTILGGIGTISGTVAVNAGGILTAATRGTGGVVAATDVGQLNVGTLTLASTSVFHADLLSTTSRDLLNVTGTVGLGGSTLELNIAGGLTFAPGTSYVLIANDNADTITGTFAGLPQGTALTANGYQFTVNYAGGDGNDFAIVAVPEPSTWFMVAAVGILGLQLRRRQTVR